MKQGDPGYWQWRKKVGAKKKIKSPQFLWELACDYFSDMDSRPMIIQEQRKGQIRIDKEAVVDSEFMKEIKNPVVQIETMRPYTWEGFEAFMAERGIITNFDHYRYNLDGRYEEFVPTIRLMHKIIYTQKFEGAAVNIFNSSIISRDLGLVDRSEMKVTEEQPLFDDEEESID